MASPSGIPFGRWLAYQRHRDDAVGALARSGDPDPLWSPEALPADLRPHLGEGPAAEVLEVALEQAEDEWRADCARRARWSS